MTHAVFSTRSASAGLVEIDECIVANDSIERADYVLNHLEDAVQSFAEFPKRGHYPAELLELGIQEYREIESTTFRIIYRVDPEVVYIYLIASARRDLEALLQRRQLST